jgi:integrase
MPRAKQWPPKAHAHKASGQDRVTVDDRHVYLGPTGSEQAKQKYDELIARLTAERAAQSARASPLVQPHGVPATGLTVAELLERYDAYATNYYVKNGTPTKQLQRVRTALKFVRDNSGAALAARFGPLALEEVRSHMVERGWRRGTVNAHCDCVVRCWRWAASRELVPPGAYESLRSLDRLKAGRTAAPESEPVRPPEPSAVEAALTVLPRVVADMVRVQRLTGARGGELCSMRASQIRRVGDVHVYEPADHKTAHDGKGRAIAIGPRAWAVIEPHLPAVCPLCATSDRRGRIGWRDGLCGPCADRTAEEGLCGPWPLVRCDGYVFSPREAERDRLADMRARRKSKVQPSQQHRKKPARRRAPGECYTSNTYAQAVRRACRDAGVEPWFPNQLRHEAATEIRRLFGLDAARAALGHSETSTTEIYAEQDRAAVLNIAKEIG